MQKEILVYSAKNRLTSAYPFILTEISEKHFSGYAVNVPDLDIDTQGEKIADAISMARDAIGMWACFEIDEGRKVPQPSSTDIVPFRLHSGKVYQH